MEAKIYKNKWLAVLIVVLGLLLPAGCKTGESDGDNGRDNEPPGFELSAVGSESTLEIATWNLKNFPTNGNTSIEYISSIIQQLDIDLYAVQEIADIDAFQRLVDGLADYDGLYSQDVYAGGQYQKTGIIYKRGIISVLSVEMLFSDDTYAFPRPPLLLRIDAQKDGNHFDFFLIVMHLKAFHEPEDIERRRSAAAALKNYLDQRIADQRELEKDFIAAGDWNDELDDPPAENAFQVFIDAPGAYLFLTMPLAGDDLSASYPSWGSLIDHILVSNDCLSEYQNGSIQTLRLDDRITDYFSTVSDHRPVMATFPVF